MFFLGLESGISSIHVYKSCKSCSDNSTIISIRFSLLHDFNYFSSILLINHYGNVQMEAWLKLTTPIRMTCRIFVVQSCVVRCVWPLVWTILFDSIVSRSIYSSLANMSLSFAVFNYFILFIVALFFQQGELAG